MIPNINTRGASFKGVTAYLMHDKKAITSERVAWTQTRNLHTENIDNASKVMAYTDMNADSLKQSFGGSAAGVKREAGAVYHFSLSEDPKNNPSQEEWENYIDKNIEKLGLSEHQYFMVAHDDEDHAHVHIVVNLIHPETGKINSLHNDYKKLDRLAHEYELEKGIVCEERHKKYQAWEEKQKAFKEKENREEYAQKVTIAFQQSDNSQSFKNALEHEGLTLSKGNRRGVVLVDEQGQIFALNRLIKFDDDIKRTEKNQQINSKLKDIDKETLPLANKLQEQRQTHDRDEQEIIQQKNLAEASEKSAENQLKIESEANKILAKKTHELKNNHSLELSRLKKSQSHDIDQYVQKLRDTDSLKEAEHREFYEPYIKQQKRERRDLQDKINQTGLKGVYFRMRRGKETREEISALAKNIANAEMRLNEGIGGLNRFDYDKIQTQKQKNISQVDELKERLNDHLKKAEGVSQKLAEDKLLNQDMKKGNFEHDQKTTQERAGEILQLARDPLQNLRGWMDETGGGRGNGRLPIGQESSIRTDNELLPIRGEEKGRIIDENTNEQQDNKQSSSNDNVRDKYLSKEDIEKNVKAQELNYGSHKKTPSLMDGLSAEHREKIESYKRDHPAEKELKEKQSQKPEHGQSPDLE